MTLEARELIKLRKLEEQTICKEKWCEEQQKDLEDVFNMVEDLVAQAVACGNSAHGYSQLEQAKTAFKRQFVEISSRYRHV